MKLTRLLIISAAFLLIAKYSIAAGGYLGMQLPDDFTAFSADSPWRTPIAENAEVDPNSDAMIANLQSTLVTQYKQPRATLGIAYKQWTAPIHVIDIDASPKVTVYASSDGFHESVDPNNRGYATGIPMPSGVWADPQTDGHMILVDPVKRIAIEFSRAKRDSSGKYKASNIAKWDLNSKGYMQPFSGRNWWHAGVTGSGVALIGGMVRYDELKSGEIKHALMVHTPINRKKISSSSSGICELCWPIAARTDGAGTGPQFIPEGARIQLNPNLNLDTLGLSNDTKIIARALQKYGAYVMDNGGSFAIKFQNLGSTGGGWNNHQNINIDKIPVSEFRVLKCSIVKK